MQIAGLGTRGTGTCGTGTAGLPRVPSPAICILLGYFHVNESRNGPSDEMPGYARVIG